MDPEFQRALTVVLIAGTFVIGVGAGTLVLVFRRFEGPKAGGHTHMAIMFGLLAFVFLACLILFALSYSRW